MAYVPRPLSGQLTVYRADDGNLYALNTVDGQSYQVSTGAGGGSAPAGVPEAPTDSQLYGRKNAAWTAVPPSGVQKTGDTMTGQLIVKGDQFDQNITGSPTPAFMIENSTTGDQIGIAGGMFGDSITFVKGNGTQANVRSQGTIIMGLGYPNTQMSSTNGVAYAVNDGGGNSCNAAITNLSGSFSTGLSITRVVSGVTQQLQLAVNATGDLVVSCITGANAGKSVNLTSGKWV